jgi:hypothetical protein
VSFLLKKVLKIKKSLLFHQEKYTDSQSIHLFGPFADILVNFACNDTSFCHESYA